MMVQYTDQTGKSVALTERPRRIVSLVPSQSEFLWDIGLREELVGITKFCIHPGEMHRKVRRVGGTKQLDLDTIRGLKPDLIIGNKEENEKAQIEVLQNEFPVWMSDIYSFDDAFDMMASLGDVLGKHEKALAIIDRLKLSVSRIKNKFEAHRVAYFIWNNPYMLAAGNTFIDHVLQHLGWQNAASHLVRYPEIDPERLEKMAPDYCFLSSEPFPFKQKHVDEIQKLVPHSKIRIVDGEVFSWYGSRLLHLEEYVNSLVL